MAKAGRVAELESELEREKQERADAEERATRAKERAREADEAYRRLQLELVAAKDEAAAARDGAKQIEEKLASLEAEATRLREAAAEAAKPAPAEATKAASARPAKKSSPAAAASASPSSEVTAVVEQMLARIAGLREMLATASIELSQLHADEVALGKKRTRVLTDACALLARAVGATGEAPPPIPSAALEARLSIAPVVDISEVADLIESLRPPRAPKV